MADSVYPPARAWKRFSAFQVLGDHVPMPGFRLVVRIGSELTALDRVLETRARETEPLDPDLACIAVRTGLGLVSCGFISFVYATPEETIALLRSDVAKVAGESLVIHNHLVSMYAARFALLSGQELPMHGGLFEFPDLGIVRRVLSTVQEAVEETTPLRSCRRLGAQLRGRGETFDNDTLDSIAAQSGLLRAHGIDIDALPPWWWRGVAARARPGGALEVFDELPAGDEFGALLQD